MIRKKAFVDDQLAARQFNTGDTVRKSGLRGFLLSPYAGRVLYANPDTGVVQVQWPWGAELESATELAHDTSCNQLPPSMDQSYSTWEGAKNINSVNTIESDVAWRKSLASSIVQKYENKTLPVYRLACKAIHDGLSEVEAFAKISSVTYNDFSTDCVRVTISNLYNVGHKMALYWADPKRKYRVTQQEKNSGALSCPRCKSALKPRIFRQGKRFFLCKTCGFSIHPKDILK
jgi:hypothetical protein